MKTSALLSLLLVWLAAGCQVFEQRIREPAEVTSTPNPFTTATPGGRISVWMVTPADATPAPGETRIAQAGQVIGPAATATAAAE
ncbi:MAG: hypothetical protein HC915_20740, partial [Anaerolineae bacterium]|nr:hypothetical protein [Anaerolineae bacterium]